MSDYYTHPDGSPRTFQERQAARDAEDRARKLAGIMADQSAKRNAKPTSGFEPRIAELRAGLKYATPTERQRIHRRLEPLTTAHEKWEDDQRKASFSRSFDKSDLAKLAMESVETIRRSGSAMYPNMTPEQRDDLLAMVEVRHAFGSPEEFGKEFFARLSVVEDQETQAAAAEAADKKLESERLEAESLRLEVASKSAEARKAALPEVPHAD
ncbi:MAG: hypothetical protein WDZ51_03805 [Pirellulaceae bacterium]